MGALYEYGLIGGQSGTPDAGWPLAVSRLEQLMITHGHPLAQEFRAYLDFFGGLPQATDPAIRFVSYVDADNCIELGRPALGMAGLPCPADPREMPTPGAERRVLAAGADRWQDWAPELERGLWIVRSTDRRMAHYIEGVSTRIQSIRLKDRYVARLYRPTQAEFAELLDIAGLWQTDGLLTGGASPALADESDASLLPALQAHALTCWADRRDAWL